jgi:hypothetical protein
MLVSLRRDFAPTRAADDEADLEQIRFDDVLQRFGVFC